MENKANKFWYPTHQYMYLSTLLPILQKSKCWCWLKLELIFNPNNVGNFMCNSHFEKKMWTTGRFNNKTGIPTWVIYCTHVPAPCGVCWKNHLGFKEKRVEETGYKKRATENYKLFHVVALPNDTSCWEASVGQQSPKKQDWKWVELFVNKKISNF